jgi:hypothetical protein
MSFRSRLINWIVMLKKSTMKEEDLLIHGSMFLLLKKFVENNFDQSTWLKIIKVAGAAQSSYEMHRNYPASEMFSIISTAANYSGIHEEALKEKFGEYLVPDLLELYKMHVKPEWRTFEMLENTEKVMHKAVREEASEANPPVLSVTRVSNKLLIIDYYSKRKMASLAIGIIKGIAKYYNESEKLRIVPNTRPNDERVQLRVEFR